MPRFLFLLIVLFSLTVVGSKPAFAYYDDVHYALTYYIARQSGYTPQQAHRIASACSMVDWDPDTEPVQGANQGWLLVGLKGAAQAPRAKFHAMRDEREYDNVLGNSENGQAAQAGVLQQRKANWEMALNVTKNPGAFLHAFQDEKPHYGYGTAWGHWPMLPGCVKEYKDAGLAIGGGTDWISFRDREKNIDRESDVLALCQSTNDWLTRFMDKASPHQFYRPYYENEFKTLVQQLALANPAPPPINSELKRQLYVQFYAKSAGVPQQLWGNLVDPGELSNIGSQLGIGLSNEDLQKQKNGPDVEKAIKVVNAALKQAGMTDTVPHSHIRYDMDEEGRLANPAQLDDWVLTGSLQTSIKGGNPVKAILKMQVRDRNGKSKEMPLPGFQPIQMKPGVDQKWPGLPIGEVILELERQDGSKLTQKFNLNKRENVFPPIRVDDEEGIGGHWLWVREGKDEKGKKITDLVPAYLTPQEDGVSFNGVYFPYLTIKTLVRTPDRSPTRIKFRRQAGSAFGFTFTYPGGGAKGTGTMTLAGNSMDGKWQDEDGNSGKWQWVRPNAEQEQTLKKFFGR